MANADFKGKIIDEIKKSGFPLEINTALTLNKLGWSVITNAIYSNDKQVNAKEIDIIAEKTPVPHLPNRNSLVIECKKSSKRPWVFFKQNTVKPDEMMLTVVSTSAVGDWYRHFSTKISDHHYSKNGLCTFYVVPYLSQHDENVYKNEETELYKAIRQVLNALIFNIVREDAFIKKMRMVSTKLLYPVIVFDGNLFSAEISGDDIKLSEENHVCLLVNREFNEDEIDTLDWGKQQIRIVKRKQFVIDIVKKDYLESYLKILEADLINVCKK